MRSKIIILSNNEDYRQIVRFLLCKHFNVEVILESTWQKASTHLGKGILGWLVDGNSVPISELVKIDKAISDGKIFFVYQSEELGVDGKVIYKPYTEAQLVSAVEESCGISSETQRDYVPVSAEILQKIGTIEVPLFVKINEKKFIKLSQPGFVFDEAAKERYANKKAAPFFVRGINADHLIKPYQREIFSQAAWLDADRIPGTENLAFNAEVLKEMINHCGWNNDVPKKTMEFVKKAIKISTLCSDLNRLLTQFNKIERLGYAEHCILINMVSSQILAAMGIDDGLTLRQMAFASLYHDLYLQDHQYSQEARLIQSLTSGAQPLTADMREILMHPSRAADFCRRWELCPTMVDTIIMQHHENPMGTGMPMSKSADEIHPLSAVFIIAEDFVNNYIQYYGKPDVELYINHRSKQYSAEPFAKPFSHLANTLLKKSKTAA